MAVNLFPSKIKSESSVKRPAVVMYGTRPEVREEAIKLVVEAVVEIVKAVDEA